MTRFRIALALLLALISAPHAQLGTLPYSGASTPQAPDPFFSNVVLLIPASGTNGSTVVPDFSPAVHGNATCAGSAQIDTSTFQFSPSSLAIGASSGCSFLDSADWNLAAGLFTIETFIRFSDVTGQQHFLTQWGSSGLDLGWVWQKFSDGKLYFGYSTTGTDQGNLFSSGGAWGPSNGVWYYVMVDFDGTKYREYVALASDSTSTMVASSTSLVTIFNSGRTLNIGSDSGAVANSLIGNLQALRITKGVARCANDSGCAVPTAPFPTNWLLKRDLHHDNDNSPMWLPATA
jgi:hypothetical protein